MPLSSTADSVNSRPLESHQSRPHYEQQAYLLSCPPSGPTSLTPALSAYQTINYLRKSALSKLRGLQHSRSARDLGSKPGSWVCRHRSSKNSIDRGPSSVSIGERVAAGLPPRPLNYATRTTRRAVEPPPYKRRALANALDAEFQHILTAKSVTRAEPAVGSPVRPAGQSSRRGSGFTDETDGSGSPD
jgi:hypothetical protein